MTIEQIKEHLPIEEVLYHYGLRMDKNKMICCPFHDDQKSSMRVYPATDTVYCFAGGCKIDHLDVIDFIMKMEKSTKHEAILKAKELCGVVPYLPKPYKEQQAIMKQKNPNLAFKRYHKSLHNHKLSQEYCESRSLDWHLLEIGYKSQKSVDKWGRGCLIFPLQDVRGNIVSLYGRGIRGSSHYYQKDRKGLYPGYPGRSVQKLILCESIIDAATLYPLELALESYAVLAMYGTNGLTNEHLLMISQLPNLEEVIFALDGDEAGNEAVKKYLPMLSRIHPWTAISQLDLPEGEDINSLAVSHEYSLSLFNELIGRRKKLKLKKKRLGKPEEEKPKQVAHLDAGDTENLLYQTELARYYIKGGLRSTSKDLAHLKVTLVVENEHGKKSRNGLDLYEDRQIEKIARHISDRLKLRADLVELDLHNLADELEKYRKELVDSGESNSKKVVPPSAEQKAKYLAFWKSRTLMKKIDDALGKSGIIGEYNNRRLGFCIVSSSQMPDPLHGLIQGSSGSGKTHLLAALCALIPPEWYIAITRATDNSFYNYGTYELRNKLISIEDKDAMSEEANLAFRELQTNRKVCLSTTGQDEKGHNRSYRKEVFGPIASLCCTTKGDLYADDMNRCFLLAVDESDEQTARILSYQKRLAAGEVKSDEKEKVARFMQGALRLLQPLDVVIPQATKISLPEDVKDKRRLNGLYLSLVKQITLLHQFQRKRDDQGRLVATKKDLQIANEIMFDAIVLKVDDLHGPLRSFYEKLKMYLKKVAGDQAEKYAFGQREIRLGMRLSKSTLSRFFRELLEMEYVKITSGSDRQGFSYRISYWDDNESLRSRIKVFLAGQIEGLK